MKNYRVGFKKGGNVTDVSAGPWNKKQKPKPGPKPGTGLKDLEKLKKGREAPKVKPDPYRRGWEKLPQPKWKKPIDKFPGDPKKYTKPIDKFPADPKKWQPMKEGGRTGLKKGGPKPGTHDYFLLHKKREKKAFGGPSHSVRRAVKKILKKAKAKKDTESVRDVRAGGGAIRATARQIAKKIKAKKDTKSVKDVR